MNSRSHSNQPPMRPEDREILNELLAERALHGLEDSDRAKLTELLQSAGLEDDESFDFAAAAAMLALAGDAERAPASVYTRAAQAAETFAREKDFSIVVVSEGWPLTTLVAVFTLAQVVGAATGVWVGRHIDAVGPRLVMSGGSVWARPRRNAS